MRLPIRCWMGKTMCWIVCVTCCTCFFMVYCILAVLKADMHSYLTNFTSQTSLPLENFTYNISVYAAATNQSPVSETLSRLKLIEELLIKNSTCGSNETQVNVTQCVSCLRPEVGKLKLQKITKENVDLKKHRDYFKTVPNVQTNSITDFLITPSLDCPYLLAVQPSVKDRPWERDVVRRTWGSVAETQKWPNRNINAKIKILFLVGNKENVKEAKRAPQFAELLSEALIHNDILYINMNDSYINLTLKLLSAFRWVKDNCPCTKFVLKVDFDTFVNVPLLIDTLLQNEQLLNFSVLGKVYETNIVQRSGRWAVPKSLYPVKTYPHYASGCGYVLSMNVISQIVDIAPHFPLLTIEDAFFTGLLRVLIGYNMFSMPVAFTHFTDYYWHFCDVFSDKKVLAMSSQGTKHLSIWQSFHKKSCS